MNERNEYIYIYIWINKWSSFSACIIYAIHIYIIIIILKLFSSFSVYWNIFLSQEIVSLIEWFVCSHFMFANLFISFHVDWINFHFITLGPLSLSLSLSKDFEEMMAEDLWREDQKKSSVKRHDMRLNWNLPFLKRTDQNIAFVFFLFSSLSITLFFFFSFFCCFL